MKPGKHRHRPVDLSQFPAPEQSSTVLVVTLLTVESLLDILATHAGPDGQTRSWQTGPDQPSKHEHCPSLVQLPFPVHRIAHAPSTRKGNRATNAAAASTNVAAGSARHASGVSELASA